MYQRLQQLVKQALLLCQHKRHNCTIKAVIDCINCHCGLPPFIQSINTLSYTSMPNQTCFQFIISYEPLLLSCPSCQSHDYEWFLLVERGEVNGIRHKGVSDCISNVVFPIFPLDSFPLKLYELYDENICTYRYSCTILNYNTCSQLWHNQYIKNLYVYVQCIYLSCIPIVLMVMVLGHCISIY